MSSYTTIYIDQNEEITSIIERIKKTPGSEIALVIPRNSFVSQGIVNLKILKSHCDKIGKKLILVTKDSLCRSLAERIGFKTENKAVEQETGGEIPQETVQKPLIKQLAADRPMPPKAFPKKIFSPSNVPVNQIPINPISIDGAGPSLGGGSVGLKEVKVNPTFSVIKKQPIGIGKKSFENKKQNQAGDKSSNQLIPKRISAPQPVKLLEKHSLLKGFTGSLKKIPESILIFFKRKKQMLAEAKPEAKPTNVRFDQKNQVKKVILLPHASVRLFYTFITLIIVLALLTLIFILPKAKVEIYPKEEARDYQLKIFVNSQQKEINYNDLIIPGKKVALDIKEEMEIENTKESANQGEEGSSKQIRGIITVYNGNLKSVLVLIPNTRFKSRQGLVYHSLNELRVPGYTEKNGEKIPGKATVEVVAEGEGDEYLISDQKLIMPGLEEEKLMEEIYAEVKDPFQRSNEISFKVVEESEVEKAKQGLTEKINQKAEEEFSQKQDRDFKIDKGAVQLGQIKWQLDKPIGSRADKFTLTATVKAEAFAFKEEDLIKLIDKYLEESASSKDDCIGSLDYEIFDTSYSLPKEAEFLLKVGKKCSKEIEVEKVKENILGISTQEARNNLLSLSSIERIEIETWPFWVKRIPEEKERVEINIMY